MLRTASPILTKPALERVNAPIAIGSASRRIVRMRAVALGVLTAAFLMGTVETAFGMSGFAAGSYGIASSAQYAGPGVPGAGLSLTAPVKGVGTTALSKPSTRSYALTIPEKVSQVPVSTSGQLPFTGFTVLPLLLLGVALVAVGLVGRRAARAAGGRPQS
jgi:hypothetical protein